MVFVFPKYAPVWRFPGRGLFCSVKIMFRSEHVFDVFVPGGEKHICVCYVFTHISCVFLYSIRLLCFFAFCFANNVCVLLMLKEFNVCIEYFSNDFMCF